MNFSAGDHLTRRGYTIHSYDWFLSTNHILLSLALEWNLAARCVRAMLNIILREAIQIQKAE